MASTRLTMCDLLWLILVAAIGLAWFRSDQKRAEEVREHQQRLADWRTGTADLLVRSGLAVINTEPMSDEERKAGGFGPNDRKLSPLSVQRLHFYEEIRAMGLELTVQPAANEK